MEETFVGLSVACDGIHDLRERNASGGSTMSWSPHAQLTRFPLQRDRHREGGGDVG